MSTTPNGKQEPTDYEENFEEYDVISAWEGRGGDILLAAFKSALSGKRLEQELESYKQAIEDVKLKADAEILSRELDIAQLQEELANVSMLEELIAGYQQEIATLREQKTEIQTAFETLKEWHVQSVINLEQKEQELVFRAQIIGATEGELENTQAIVEQQAKAIEALYATVMVDNEILEECQKVENYLQATLSNTVRDLVTYKESFSKLSKVAVERETQQVLQVAELTQKVAALEETVAKTAVFLAPRWQQINAGTHEESAASKVAAVLRAGNARVTVALLKNENLFLKSCVAPELWTTEIHVYAVANAASRILYKATNFLEYIYEAYYADIVQDAEENILSFQKDKGFIRWLHSTVYLNSTMVMKLSAALEAFRRASLTDLVAFLEINDLNPLGAAATGESPETADVSSATIKEACSDMMLCLDTCEQQLNRLLGAAEEGYLSPACSIEAFEVFLTAFEKLMTKNAKSNIAMSYVNFVRREDEETGKYGIPPTIIGGFIRQLGSLAVLGLCGAAYSENATAAVKPKVWLGIWSATRHVIDRIPYGNLSSCGQLDCVTEGFGLLIPRISTEEKLAVNVIQQVLTSPEEQAEDEISRRLNPQFPTVASILEHVAAMCKKYILPQNIKAEIVLPWEGSLQQSRRSLARREEDLKIASGEIAKARQEAGLWQMKFSEMRIQVERMRLYEPEVKELRTREEQLLQTIAKLRRDVHSLDSFKKKSTQEIAQLKTKSTELSQILESTRKLPKHQYQLDWDALEIANLRAINTKLEREICALHMGRVEVDLRTDDLEQVLGNTMRTGASDAAVQIERSNDAATGIATLLHEFKDVQRLFMQHTLRVPLFQDRLSTNHAKREAHMADYASLQLKISILKKSIKQQSARLGIANVESSSFGSDTMTPGWGYLKALSAADSRKALPVSRIQLADTTWVANSKQARSSVCKLAATSSQLQAVHKMLLGL